MPIPELKTDNADFSNTLLKIRTMQQQDEQNRLLSGAKEAQNALVVHQQKKADAEAKKAWLENAGRQVSQLAILPDREMLNGYQAMYASDKEKNELGLPPMDVFANDKKEIDVEKVRTYLNRTAGIWTGKPGTSVKHIVRNDKADFEKPESLDNPYTLEVSGVYGDNGLFVANNASPVVNPFRVQEFKDKQEKRAQAALDETKRHNRVSESTSAGNLEVARSNSAREAEKKTKVPSDTINQVRKTLVSKYLPLAQANADKDSKLIDPTTGGVNEALVRSVLTTEQKRAYDKISINAEKYALTMTPAAAVDKALSEFNAEYRKNKKTSTTATKLPRKTVNGKTYEKRSDGWYEVGA